MNNRKSIFTSAIAGNVLEYFDFTVYAVFYSEIARAFFPSNQPEYVQILESLAVFAVGFFMRPVGGIVFGYIGDSFGRRTSLIVSMLGMTIPTFSIGFIPSFESIGYAAPTILVLMRLVQGLCISGEGAGAAIFILEHHQNLRPGFTAGIVHGSNILGTFIATFVGMGINFFMPESDHAWRFAFLLGGFMGLAGFYLRLKVSETPIFTQLAAKKKTNKMPFMNVAKESWRSMVICASLGAAASSIVYLVKSYLMVSFCSVFGMSKNDALPFVAYASLILMITMPISGYISDIIGRYQMILYSAIANFVLVLPTLYLISCSQLWQQILVTTALAALGGMISGTAYVFIICLFKPSERFSGVAFSYNFGIALCGGTSAFISRLLVAETGLYYAPAFYIMLTFGLFLAVLVANQKLIKKLMKENLS